MAATKLANQSAIPQRAVVIEPDQIMQKLVVNYLEGAGVSDIDVFEDGHEALRAVQKYAYDLVIMDWKLKDPAGTELYEEIRGIEEYESTAIILISGFVTRDDVLVAQMNTATKFLVKPFTEELLVDVVKNAAAASFKQDPEKHAARAEQVKTNLEEVAAEKFANNNNIDTGDMRTSREDDNGEEFSVNTTSNNVFNDEAQRMSRDEEGGGEFEARQQREQVEGGGDPIIQKGELGDEFSINQKRESTPSQEGDPIVQKGELGEGFMMNQEAQKGPEQGDPTVQKGQTGDGFMMNQEGQTGEGFSANQEGQKGPDQGGPITQRGELGEDISANQEAAKGPDQGDPARQQGDGGGDGWSMETNSGDDGGSDGSERQNLGGAGDLQDTNDDDETRQARQGNTDGEFDANQTRDDAGGDMSGTFSSDEEGAPPAPEARDQEIDDILDNDAAEEDDGIETPVIMTEKIFGKEISISAPKRAIIIDSDESLTKLMEGYLTKLGTPNVDLFVEGKGAWKSIKDHRYDIIIMDWRLKGISGLCLYNRIRMRKETKETPIIVLSGFVNKEDFRVLDESKCTTFMEKPFQVQIFDKTVKETFLETATFATVAEKMGAVLDNAKGDEKKILGVIQEVLKKIPNAFQFISAAGQFLLQKKDYKTAEKVLKIAMRLDPKSVTILSELAKVYHRQNRPNEALKLLERAQQFAPGNIERLCQLGEVGLTLHDTDKARKFFKEALDIDEENATAKSGLVLADNIEDHLKGEGADALPVNRKLASTCNIVGITQVRNKNFDKGIEQYEAAMAFIHDDETLARLQFNLAMAYLRNEDFKKASAMFDVAAGNAGPDFTKAAKYQKKMKAFEAGGSLHDLLADDDSDEEEVFMDTASKPATDDSPEVLPVHQEKQEAPQEAEDVWEDYS